MAANGQHHRPAPIQATLLGQVRINVGDRLINENAWSLRSARSLLLLLLITRGHTISKDRVLDTLWPEANPDVGRNALYKALHLLRRVLEPELTSARKSAYIETRGDTITIFPSVDIWVDVDAYEHKLSQAMQASQVDRRKLLREAVNLYGGELLPTDPYEDWPLARREALRAAWEDAVLELAELDLDANEPQASVPSLELLLAHDPTVETAHRSLMRGYIAAGQRDRALRQYARCVTALENELGITPDVQTQDLHAAIEAAAPEPDSQPGIDAGSFNNLPSPPTAIVGRDREIENLKGTLWRQDVRLVTLVGPGGVGKTRLALEVASQLVEDFVDGIAFVSLSAIRDPNLVLQAITQTFGLSEEPNVPAVSSLVAYLCSRDMLLVLDNFEQVLDATPEIGELLANCASLTVLVTSRERLQLRGEHIHEVPPLAVPRPDRLPSPSMLGRYGSIELFRQHMQRIDPDFDITVVNSAVISAICGHLEGLPLAIELATARARFYSLDGLLSRLTSRLDIEEGARDLPSRQKTLRATVAWSHDLLSPEEQAVFRRLSTAIGGYTTDTAEDICGDENIQVHRLIHSLAEKHLIRWEKTESGPRITMLETIREYALECLHESGEGDAVKQRHSVHFLHMVTQAADHLVGTDQIIWFERFETEQGNLRLALEWGFDRQEDIGLTAALSAAILWRYWLRRRALSEGITWLERASALKDLPPSIRTRVLLALAHLREAQSDYARAETLIEEALPISRQIGDQSGVAKALNGLGEIAEDRGDFARATSLHQQALEIYQNTGLRRNSAGSLNKLAIVAYYQGDYETATTLWEESVQIYNELEDHWAAGVVLGNLGAVAMATKDFDKAVTLHQENLEIAHQLKDPGSIGRALCNLAEAFQMRGDGDQDTLLEEALDLHRETHDKQCEISTLTLMAFSALERGNRLHAATLFAEGLTLCESIGDLATMASSALLERIAALAVVSDQPCDAVRLLGASSSLRKQLGAPIMPYLEQIRDRTLEQAQAVLGSRDLDTALDEGHILTSSAAVKHALKICSSAS